MEVTIGAPRICAWTHYSMQLACRSHAADNFTKLGKSGQEQKHSGIVTGAPPKMTAHSWGVVGYRAMSQGIFEQMKTECCSNAWLAEALQAQAVSPGVV